MKLVVGLGNPGQKYIGTRHNVGFDVIAELGKRYFHGRPKNRFNGEIAEIQLANERVFLTCPLTYMNLSGQFVRSMVDFYKIDADQVLVVCDDFNLPLANLRIRTKGSAGGQKGLNDIINRLGSPEVPRLRIGVGPVPSQWNAADFVLGKFNSDESETIAAGLINAADAVECWITQGIQAAMNRFNTASDSKLAATHASDENDTRSQIKTRLAKPGPDQISRSDQNKELDE